MADRVHARMFRGIVAELGGVHAAAAVIEASTGESCSVGTISKIQNGEAQAAIGWVWALEDASGNRAFSRLRARVVSEQDGLGPATLCHLQTMREAHEAVMAQAQAEASTDPDILARAIKETADLMVACETAHAALTARMKGAPAPERRRGSPQAVDFPEGAALVAAISPARSAQ